ncbi:MAG: trypsin-like peptidase domain-containing protein, partial [Gemmatimonadota bacterium]|nr:trypsin-like peptidase domain-containing protein [Gemmatimonadota bacterium]
MHRSEGPDEGRQPLSRTTLAGGLGFLLGLAVLGLVAAIPGGEPSGPALGEERSANAATLTVEDPYDMSLGFAAVAERTTPGVVRIETTRVGSASAASSMRLPPGFEQFFRSPIPEPTVPQLSGGTGFVMSDDGYIITNHHVVEDAQDITVWLADRRSFEAELIGSDPTTDVAVLRIEADDLTPLPLGDSERVRVGEWVVAVGNPGFQGGRPLDETVTAGIVSAIGRPLTLIRNELARDPENREIAAWAIEDFIQTDAVINPGNSGGPLVNIEGEVVGMNTAIMSATGYYQGYGFAVPVNLVMGVAEDLIENGTVRRGWIGLRISGV